MKKSLAAALVIASMVLPGSVFAQVETSLGSIQIGAKVKWLFAYKAEDEDAKGASDPAALSGGTTTLWGFDGAPLEQFATTNVELDINGMVGEKVEYIIEFQASAYGMTPADARGGLTGVQSGPAEMGTVGVRQAKIIFHDLIPYTSFTVGTFNLPLSIYQPRATNDWDLISLPLINMAPTLLGNYDADGIRGEDYAPMGLGWQATGINVAVAPIEWFEIDLSYFNGYAGGNPNAETDLEKSYLVNLRFLPENGMVSVGYLSEGWQEDTADWGGGKTQQQNASGWVASGSYEQDKFEGNFDFAMMTAEDYQLNEDGDPDDLTWMGYQVTLGYWFTKELEAVARYEWIDPNTINDKDAAAGEVTENDQLTWITAGLNYRVNETAEIAVNYIMRDEQGSDIDVDAGNVGGKYQKLDNDILLIQAQVWQ
ncbi:MAG: hypothetical protein R6V10_07285 [bacterium]